MTFSRSKSTLLFAALLTSALLAVSSRDAAAQQITYYDFNAPYANPSQYSYACSPTGTNSALFCFNGNNGSSANPPFLSDFYPPYMDPNAASDGDLGSSNYATRMTLSQSGQAASMWFSVPQNVANGFNAWFAFKITPDNSSQTTADGLAFVIQNSPTSGGTVDPGTSCGPATGGPTALGGGGGCMGYSGINNSVALEFDTYNNGTGWDPNNNHIALQDCGPGLPNSAEHYTINLPAGGTENCSVSLGSNTGSVSTLISSPVTSATTSAGQTPVTLADGTIHQVVVVYNGPNDSPANTLSVYLDPAFNPGTVTPVPGSIPVFTGSYDITTALNLINGTNAYIGFTSATGEFFEDHELMAWTYTPHTPVTQQQPLNPPAQPGSTTYQQFPFGTHTYGVQYNTDSSLSTPTSGITMTLTASTVSPALFSQLINGTPYQGSSCQIYDDTGGNCVIYSVSCTVTATGQSTPCPAVTNVPNCTGGNAAACIAVKTTYNSSQTPVSPGFIQGDPFYSQISSIVAGGGTGTVTCTGECSVTTGQTVTVFGAAPSDLNGTITVLSADPNVPNTFTFSTGVTDTSTTGGYLTSSNVQNIFTSWTAQNIDGTTTGKTTNFSDFVFTTTTNNASTSIQLGAQDGSPIEGQADPLTATVAGLAGQLAPPTGDVIFYAGNTVVCTSPVSTTSNVTTATCNYTPNTSALVSLTAQYVGDPYHLTILSSPLNLTATPATPTVTWPSASAITYGQTLGSSNLTGGSAVFDSTTVPGNFAFTAPTTVPGAGSPSESVTFTPSGTAYNSVTNTIAVQVNKAPTSVSIPPTATAINSGQTLASSALSGGTVVSTITGATVPGTFTFTNPATAPNGTASQSVTFTPMDATDYLGTTTSVPVTVTPVPIANVSPTSINFGTSIYFGSILTHSVTITNTGSAAMTISDPFISIVKGGDSSEFVSVSLCPKSLAVGKSCIMEVIFLAGPFYTPQTATLQINDNAAGSPQTVMLSATVINPVAQFSPGSLSFGTTKTNSGSVTKSITLTSAGGTTLSIPTFSFGGADPGDFKETSTCTAALAPKANCNISVTFSPKAKGSRTATLVVTDNAQNSPQSIPLSGTGN
jgi:hypothetical protein